MAAESKLSAPALLPAGWRLCHDARRVMLGKLGIAPDRLAHDIGRPVHSSSVNAGEVLAENAEREQLRAGENRDDGSQKRESRYAAARGYVSDQHIDQYADAENRKGESDHAREL